MWYAEVSDDMRQMVCPICSAVVQETDRHSQWHLDRGEWDE